MTTNDPIKEARSNGRWLVFFAICFAALGGIVLSQTGDLRDSLAGEPAPTVMVVGDADSVGLPQESPAWSTTARAERQEHMDKLKQAGGLVLVFALFLFAFGVADLVRPTPAQERAVAAWRKARRGRSGGEET